MKILADGSLPELLNAFPKPFELTCYHNEQELKALLPSHDILLCRATLQVNQALLKHSSIKIVATATSGSCHIDKSYLLENNISLIDAAGANASAVADYTLSCLAYLSQAALLKGHTASIIGLGHVGTLVYQRLTTLGFTVHCFDPLKAEADASFASCTFDTLLTSDILCIHANLHEKKHPSVHLINESFLKALKPKTVIINAARGGIVHEQALIDLSPPIIYCTDVYMNEPDINKEIVQKSLLCTPHIAGHSIEAKQRAVYLVSYKIHQFLQLPLPSLMHQQTYTTNTNIFRDNWQSYVLERYNPAKETQALKTATDLATQFNKLRKAHYRHDF